MSTIFWLPFSPTHKHFIFLLWCVSCIVVACFKLLLHIVIVIDVFELYCCVFRYTLGMTQLDSITQKTKGGLEWISLIFTVPGSKPNPTKIKFLPRFYSLDILSLWTIDSHTSDVWMSARMDGGVGVLVPGFSLRLSVVMHCGDWI